MEIVPSTYAEFEGLRPRNTLLYGFVKELKVGTVVRLRGHKHVVANPKNPMALFSCRVYKGVRMMAIRHGMQLRMVHDGADLLVMRVK